MNTKPLVSISINNYNYDRFLRESIDSALNQTYDNVEVIVVDDGSTDGSRQIIDRFGDRVRKIYKDNGGQTSALNAAFAASFGDILCFVDADDTLNSTVIEQAVSIFQDDEQTVKVHWPLSIVNENNEMNGNIIPIETLSEPNALEKVLRDGPNAISVQPTTGNIWTRKFLEKVMPLPEIEKRIGVGSASADACLSMLAPLFGRIQSISESQGCYRVHGQNDFFSMSFEKKHKRGMAVYNHRCALLETICKQRGFSVDTETWKRNSWEHRIESAAQELLSIVSAGETFILVDDEQWGMDKNFRGRHRIPFLEKDGEYWGPPSDNTVAINELERLRRLKINFIVFAWPAFWWLDSYSKLIQYLRSKFHCVIDNNSIIVFDLSR